MQENIILENIIQYANKLQQELPIKVNKIWNCRNTNFDSSMLLFMTENIPIIKTTSQDVLQRLLFGVCIAALFLADAWICRFSLPSSFFFLFRALYPALVSLHAKDARLLVNGRTVNYPGEKEREREHLMFQRVKTIGSSETYAVIGKTTVISREVVFGTFE